MDYPSELREMAERYRLSEHIHPLLTDAAAEIDRLKAENADLLAALQIVKSQRQHWWGKAVERGAKIQRLETSCKAWELQAKGFSKIINASMGG